MILSGARRFCLLLGARSGWWGWLIAALVASLVSVSVAGAATPSETTPAVSGPLARPASLQTELPLRLSIIVLKEISKSQLPGSAGIGRLLEQFGLVDKPAPDILGAIAGIKGQLGEIESRLTKLETGVTQLRAEVAQSEYSVLVGQTTGLTSAIDSGMEDLDAVADTPANDPAKKGFTDATLEFIKNDLLGKQQELAQKITGVAGSDGLIKAFSKAMKTRSPYWTDRTSNQVREVYDYYQAEEARLLLLRVEYWHAHPLIYPASYVDGQIKKVEQEVGTPEKVGVPAAVGTQEDLLKPSPGPDVLADTRTNLLWGYHDLRYQYTGTEAKYWAERYHSDRNPWRLPYASEVRELVRGWPGVLSGQTWPFWLDNDQLGGQLHTIQYTPFLGWHSTVPGVWTLSPYCGIDKDKCYAISAYLHEDFIYDQYGGVLRGPDLQSLLLVKPRTQTYWW